jgi:F-type H+-transporting ATPase subunit delta
MIDVVIAKRYARALIQVAQAENSVDAYGEELANFLEASKLNEDLLATLSHKGFDLMARLRILDAMCAKINPRANVKNFLKLLLRRGRIALFPIVCREYHSFADKIMGRQVMTVTSARELSEKDYQQLEKYFGEKFSRKMILKKKIDRELLGGVSVLVGDHVYDYTLRNQWEQIKKKMMM